MSRYIVPLVADLAEDQRQMYDNIVNGPRAQAGAVLTDAQGRLASPFGVLLLNPAVGDLLQQLGLAVQGHCALDGSLRERVIMSVAARRGNEFEWRAHEKRARGFGATDEQVAAVRAGAGYPGISEFESDVFALTEALLAHKRVDEELYSRLSAATDDARVILDIVLLIGYYDTLASLFSAFEL